MSNQPAAASAPRPRAASAADAVRRRAAARRRAWLPYLFLLPATLLIGAFVVYPVATVFYYSLQQYDQATHK